MAIKQRSPNYPGFDLSEAVEATKRLYPNVQRGEFTLNDAAKHLGYNSVSGPVRRRIGALRQYGLIEQEKGKNIRLTERALTICLRNVASEEYRNAAQDAALEPPLIREFYESNKHASSDDALRQELIVKRSFTDEGASTFIRVLRATLDLTGLTEYDKMSGQEKDKFDGEGDTDMDSSTGVATRSIHIPYTDGSWAKLEASFPMSEADWNQMMAVLDVMKPGLVSPGDKSKDAASPVEKALSEEARELLDKVENGGIPTSMNPSIEAIAKQHGIRVNSNTTPDEIIEQLLKLQ